MLLEKVRKTRENMEIVVDSGQETVEIDRSQYIGGSDIPIILGISGFTKPNKLAQLKNKVIPYENKKTLYTEFGHIFEPFIREVANKKFNMNTVPCCKTSEELGLRANCDGYDSENSLLLEVKTNNGEHEDKADYIAQIHFYMAMYDVKKCILAEYGRTKEEEEIINELLESNASDEKLNEVASKLFDKNRIKFTEIDYNEELENKIFFCIENFKNIDLEMAKRNNNFEILCKIYGKLETEKDKENFEKMSKVMESLDDFFEDKNIINGIEKNMIEFINQDFIKEKIKNGKYDFFKYKSATVSNKFDTKTFKKENPSIYQNYIKEVEVVTNDSIRGKIIKYTPFMEIENREIAKLEENFESFKAKISENVTDEELKGISTMRNKLVQVKEELENQSIVDTETLLRMIEENGLKELPTIDTKHFYFLRGKKSTQQRINKKLLEFEHPELLEKYTKSEEVEEKVEFK
jgi:yqaJ viral recombinase family protein